jgi:integrase
MARRKGRPGMSKPEGHPKRFHFSVTKLEALPVPADKPIVYFDSEVPHLGLRCQPTGTRTFVVIKRSRGVTYRKTLDQFPDLKIEAARATARRLLNQNAAWKANDYEGVAPLAKPVDKEVITFGQMFEAHVRQARKESEGKGHDPDRTEKNLRYVYDANQSEKSASRFCLSKRFENTPLENMTPSSMAELHADLSETRKVDGKKRGGKFTANRALELIRAVFNTAIQKGLATTDPTRGVEMHQEKKRKRFLQPEELLRLDKVLAEEANQDVTEFTKLLLSTGVRKSSLYSARWEQISFERKAWDIPVTKNGEPLTVQLTDDAMKILKAREAQRVDGNPWVFPTKAGSTTEHVTDYRTQWNRIRKSAGVADIRTHDLRRTFASYQAIGGASLQMVGSSLGHKDSKSTEVYSHLVQSAVRQSIESGEQTRKQMMKDAAKRIKSEERRKARKLQLISVPA